MSEKPGPEVAVMALRPARDAPMTAPRPPISSSIWMNTPSGRAGSFWAMSSMISDDGVMG